MTSTNPNNGRSRYRADKPAHCTDPVSKEEHRRQIAAVIHDRAEGKRVIAERRVRALGGAIESSGGSNPQKRPFPKSDRSK